MKRLAIKHIAGQVAELRRQAGEIEDKHMDFDCQFDDKAAEDRYHELCQTTQELELMCCTTFEDATYLQQCIMEAAKGG